MIDTRLVHSHYQRTKEMHKFFAASVCGASKRADSIASTDGRDGAAVVDK
jgi:hypothetical protein